MKQISKKVQRVLVIILAVIFGMGIFLLGFFSNRWIYGNDADTLKWVVSMIDKYYYSEEQGVIKEFSATDYADAITSALLDKYSTYYSEEKYADVISTNQGNYYGTGLSFLKAEPTAKIYSVELNSPAFRKGIRAGDIITAVEYNGNKETITSKDNFFVKTSAIKAGENFNLYYQRGANEFCVELSRQVFVASYVEYFDNTTCGQFTSEGAVKPVWTTNTSDERNDLDDSTAFIHLTWFEGNAKDEIKEVYDYLIEKGKTKIILDLRDNGGGDMSILKGIASYFIKGKSVICYMKYKSGDVNSLSCDMDNFNNQITDICVLANQNTASASECLIGAMLYYKCAFNTDKLIIEKNNDEARTFGKGIMQTTFKNVVNAGGGAIKLTTAYVYQPDNETCIHGKGIFTTQENSVEKGQAINRAIEILGQ